MWPGVASCSLLSVPMTQPSYLTTVSPERCLFQEESAANLHDKDIGEKRKHWGEKKKSFPAYLSILSPRAALISVFAALVAPQFEERLNRGLKGGRD